MITDFEEFFIRKFFSLLFDLPRNSGGTPADPSRYTGVPTALNTEPESELLSDWRFTANQFVLATTP
jgi:hypothetical protein